MGTIHSTETRVRALETFVAAMLNRLSADARQHLLAEAFVLGMAGPGAVPLCAALRCLALAAEDTSEQLPSGDEQRAERQNGGNRYQ